VRSQFREVGGNGEAVDKAQAAAFVNDHIEFRKGYVAAN
jgi:hypothetical protein